METLNPQYIKDSAGKSLVVLYQKEFENLLQRFQDLEGIRRKLLEKLEDLEDVRLYDQAKKSDTGEQIPIDEAFRMIEKKREENGLWVTRLALKTRQSKV